MDVGPPRSDATASRMMSATPEAALASALVTLETLLIAMAACKYPPTCGSWLTKGDHGAKRTPPRGSWRQKGEEREASMQPVA